MVIRRLIAHVGGVAGQDFLDRRVPRGKHSLDRRLEGLKIAAQHSRRVFVLRDLDNDGPCPGALLDRMLPDRPSSLIIRLAVRSVDAWLMADQTGLASALHVRPNAIPERPEALADPKRTLRDLALKSRDRTMREIAAESAQAFAGVLADFAADAWRIERALASEAAPSLQRAVERLSSLAR